jgi:hypothetical protein
MRYEVNNKVIYVGFNHQYEERLIERKGQSAIMIPAPYLTECKISLEGCVDVCENTILDSSDYNVLEQNTYDDITTLVVTLGQRTLGEITNSEEHPDNVLIFTEARCSHGDNFCKLSGRKISFNKALAILSAAGLLNKSERAQLFNQVFPQYKKNKVQNTTKAIRIVMEKDVEDLRKYIRGNKNCKQLKILNKAQNKASSVWNQIKTWWSK